jgi:maltoporin
MRHLSFSAAAIAVAMLASLAPAPARAEIEYPYCGYARLGAGGCTFSTLAQCQAFIAGTGGRCERNARYAQGANAAASTRVRR